jgi:hypothetical protein
MNARQLNSQGQITADLSGAAASKYDPRSVNYCEPRRQDSTASRCCFTPYGPPPDPPDLAIYSQSEQFALGIPPTWDSPDILTNFWNPFRLMPESTVTVRNLSPTVSAVNGQVLFSVATFGIGQPFSLLGTQIVTLAPGQQTNLTFPFPQSVLNAAEQRIAVHVRLVHPFDGKAINNEGSQLLADAYTSQSGRSFSVSFPIVNPRATAQQISLQVLPNQLSAVVTPGSQVFAPLQQFGASLQLQVPSGVHGTSASPVRLDATIVGRDGSGEILGGLTYVVWVDN